MLTDQQLEQFQQDGHLTVDEFFTVAQIESAIKDIDIWGQQIRDNLSDAEKSWFLERDAGEDAPLRKLDDPVF
ncbi:MAG TPA: hypothetical protein EYM79_03005, partial [Planctomycetes bacterium]|nr:hypothetical protein [Planctomycetota bacterium]